MGFFNKIKEGIKKTSESFQQKIELAINSFTKIDEELFEELTEALILADLGVETSKEITDELRKRIKQKGLKSAEEVKEELKSIIQNILEAPIKEENEQKKVYLIIGVNGVGKTTTIGKIANIEVKKGKKVLLAAGDTFRAAASEQLSIWAERSKSDIIKQEEGSDPAAVIFDAAQAFKKRGCDVLICDTAGRLHNKQNLMNELAKINRVLEKELPDVKKEVLLVIDATTGQNAIAQASVFKDAANVSGVVLTKLDGTAKGGVIVAVCNILKIPVKYVGVGEKIDDFLEFEPKEFTKALFE